MASSFSSKPTAAQALREIEAGDANYCRGDYKTACAAMLNAVALNNKPNSPLILAPTGGIPHQGGTLAAAQQAAFKDAILTQWLAGE